MINIEDIKRILPHRYPFLLVDRVVELEPKVKIVAYKNLTANEQFFNGHFPDFPVMPGVLQIEALAQAMCLLAHYSGHFDPATQVPFFAGIDGAKFRKPVVPGDRLDLQVTLKWFRKGLAKAEAVASVDGQKVCEAELTAAVMAKTSA